MVLNGRPPVKRMKRRVTADLCDFLTFSDAGEGFSAAGSHDQPFRSSLRSFLSRHAREVPSHERDLLTWQIAYWIGDLDGRESSPETVAVLHVVEEDVMKSGSDYCDMCRVVGWSGHPVCWKRYHFIIRSDSSSLDGFRACNGAKAVAEDPTHLLHGMVHMNGFGHLIRVNGREGGSRFLSGCDIMGFWDRLCKMLRVRKVTVMDVSKKYGLEYRLLHAITSGHPWYGNWGYKFGAGSFAVTADAYRDAARTLSDMPLAPFFTHARASRTHLQDVISFYRSISERRLATLRDLLRFILDLLHAIHRKAVVSARKKTKNTALLLQPWAEDDINRVECAMMKVLQAAGSSRWIMWRTLKGAVSQTGPPELLDYCLKEMGGKSVDGMVVHVQCNPETYVAEYRLEDDENAATEGIVSNTVPTSPRYLSEDHIVHDLKFLYEALLQPKTMLNYKPQESREIAHSSAMKLLDCKHFVKDYEFDSMQIKNPYVIRALCGVELVDQAKDYTAPPPELIVLPTTATVADLKTEATKAFREAYIIFERFQAEKLLDFGDVDDSTNVKFLIGMNGSVRVRGRCHGSYGLQRYRMERGRGRWTVNCVCGARDDDGERMLACDKCNVWLHTRCAGIHDSEEAPPNYYCGRCSAGGQGCKDSREVAAGPFGCRGG
ncbi:PHD finger protein [Cinnamomum micranthum f. kanehirae]|uniref:PHD finger protein n=1 Tax=Cinnamomum micranthum f. kanehirae TaxID=337451 RepID=A0A3S4PGV6_9MAGN|nr:PHD finger protein [Cinnamomum micranthum f. kanehirae]